MTPETFIRKISHDLRSSLLALKDLPEWLELEIQKIPGETPDKATEILSMMKTYASRLDQMVVDLSLFARLERRDSNPSSFMREIAISLNEAYDYMSDITVETIPMEHDHAVLVVRHLLDNAVKHGGGDAQTMKLETRGTIDSISICVRDQGPGIEMRHRELVYEPLSTLQPRDVCEGSGMGLAIVAKIAEIYGGHCSMKDNGTGVGLCSSISIPRQPATAENSKIKETRHVTAEEFKQPHRT